MYKISTEALSAMKREILSHGEIKPQHQMTYAMINEILHYRGTLAKNMDYVSFGMGIVRDVLMNSLDEMAKHEDFQDISFKTAYAIIKPVFKESLDKIVTQKVGNA